MNWVLVTGAYPPDSGGLADYAAVLARELARHGDTVTVVTGPLESVSASEGISLVNLVDHFSHRGLRELEAFLQAVPHPRRMLIQYVPQVLGPRRSSRFKGLPLTFAWWLRSQPPSWPVWSMLHEAKIMAPEGSSLVTKALAGVSDRMLQWLVSGSSRIFVAMEAWQPFVKPYLRADQTLEYLPIPSNVATAVDDRQRNRIRATLLEAGAHSIVGHFGTYSTSVTYMIEKLIRRSLTEHPHRQILLIGDGSREFAAHLGGGPRVTATGRIAAIDVTHHLSACDLMLQPFPDGVSARRGSIMAAMALGVPVVSNWGYASESFWQEEHALALAPDEQSLPALIDQLLVHPEECHRLGERGRQLYERRFSLAHSMRVLRGETPHRDSYAEALGNF